jgi:hypothetical protein
MIDSGNGIQVLWRLVEPIELAENSANNIADVEPRNKAVMEWRATRYNLRLPTSRRG